MMAKQDAHERLFAAFSTEVDDETKRRHIAEMSTAIRTAPPARVPTSLALRYRLAGAAAAVVVAVAPVGMAVAAENAVPGEILYPLKQVTERVRALVDDDIAATHRVEEAERLVVRGAAIVEVERAIERAEDATSDLAGDRVLGPRLESVRERFRQLGEQEQGSTSPGVSPSVRGDAPGAGPNHADADDDRSSAGDGSVTTSLPRSADQGTGGGEGSGAGESATDEVPPPNDDAETGANQSGNRTGEHDGGGSSGPTTTGRQGSDGANGS